MQRAARGGQLVPLGVRALPLGGSLLAGPLHLPQLAGQRLLALDQRAEGDARIGQRGARRLQRVLEGRVPVARAQLGRAVRVDTRLQLGLARLGRSAHGGLAVTLGLQRQRVDLRELEVARQLATPRLALALALSGALGFRGQPRQLGLEHLPATVERRETLGRLLARRRQRRRRRAQRRDLALQRVALGPPRHEGRPRRPRARRAARRARRAGRPAA